MKSNHLRLSVLLLPFIGSILFYSCKPQNDKVGVKQSFAIIDSVDHMTDNISRDLAAKGPIAWLDYLDHMPQLFMVSDGQINFNDYRSAEKFIRDTVSKSIIKVTLKWKGKNIAWLTRDVATINSGVHEDLLLAGGQSVAYDGYFSGTAVSTPSGWKLVNLNWSTQKPVSK